MHEYVHTKFQLWYCPFLYTSPNLVKNESKSKIENMTMADFFKALPGLVVLILTCHMSQLNIKALKPCGSSLAARYVYIVYCIL